MRDDGWLSDIAAAVRKTASRSTPASSECAKGVWQWDVRTGSLHWSSDLFHLFGLDPEVHHASFDIWKALVHADDRLCAESAIHRAVENRATFEFEYRLVRRDGLVRWLSSRGFVTCSKNGEAQTVYGIETDVTKRKDADEELRRSYMRFEQALAQNQQRFRSYFELGIVAMATSSPDKRWLEVNDEFCRMTGYSREEACRLTWADLTHPDDLSGNLKHFDRALKGEINGYTMEKRFLHKDGHAVPTVLSVQAIRKPDGSVDHFLSLIHDISDVKASAEALRKSEARHRGLFQSSADGICWCSIDGRIIEANSAYAAMSGYSESELAGMPISQIEVIEDQGVIQRRIDQILDQGCCRFESKHRKKNGSIFDVEVVAQHVPAGDGMIAAVVRDISAQKHVEETLREAKMLAESASLSKSMFLANMSHEIRTPLNAMIGMSQLLQDTELSTEQREMFQTVVESGQALQALIGDILDFSAIEAGKLSAQPVDFNMGRLISRISGVLAERFREKQLRFTSDVAPEAAGGFRGDELRLGQVLINLLGNAIKFTPDGGAIGLRAFCESAAGCEKLLHFIVSDTGVGVASEQLTTMFSPFARANESYARSFGGAGLGLAICKSLVELMGGSIWAESQLGSGSHFHFTAKLAAVDVLEAVPLPPPAEEPQAPRFDRPLHILLVEDNLVNQKLGVKLLQKYGHAVTIARNGAEALSTFQANLSAAPFDLVLMDCQMPEMDGFECTGRLRMIQHTVGRHTPIIAVTAYASESDRERCLTAGMDDYISKPIDIKELVGLIARYCPSHH